MANFDTRVTLLDKIKNKHDDSAWEDFCHWYEPYIRMIVNKSQVPPKFRDDLKQEILLAVWKSISKFTYDAKKASFRAWLSQISRNKIIDFLRSPKNRVQNNESLDSCSSTIESQIDTIIEEEWCIYIAKKAFEEVKEEFTEKVFSCYELFQKGHKPEDIANELKVSENSVYVYSKRVKDSMRRKIIILSQILD